MQEQAAPSPAGGAPDVAQVAKALREKHHGQSGWFLWIAILSVINSAVMLAGSSWGFFIGLGVTQLVDGVMMAVTEGTEGSGRTVALAITFVIDLVIAGGLFLLGVLARKGFGWAYILGIVLYAADGLLFVWAQDWPGAGFHAFALFFLVGGYVNLRRLQRLMAEHPELAAT